MQAHPFRDRAYMPHILLGKDYCDAIEVGNACNVPYNDIYARAYAEKFSLRTVAGSDNHLASVEKWTVERPMMGVETEEKLTGVQDYVRLIRQGGNMRPIVPEEWIRKGLEEIKPIEAFILDENEQPVPADIDWLGGKGMELDL